MVPLCIAPLWSPSDPYLVLLCMAPLLSPLVPFMVPLWMAPLWSVFSSPLVPLWSHSDSSLVPLWSLPGPSHGPSLVPLWHGFRSLSKLSGSILIARVCDTRTGAHSGSSGRKMKAALPHPLGLYPTQDCNLYSHYLYQATTKKLDSALDSVSSLTLPPPPNNNNNLHTHRYKYHVKNSMHPSVFRSVFHPKREPTNAKPQMISTFQQGSVITKC